MGVLRQLILEMAWYVFLTDIDATAERIECFVSYRKRNAPI